MKFWLLIAFMTWLGLTTHWLKQLAMTRNFVGGAGHIDLKTYWVTYWPETITAWTSAIAGVALLYEFNHVTPAAAFGVGYLGNSIADLIGNRLHAVFLAAMTPPEDKK